MSGGNQKKYPRTVESRNTYLRIRAPEHLDVALEGLIRKVLKEQPNMDDIYSFAADYFDALLKIREKSGHKKLSVQDICPFHNDEDAHEMIKLASTLAKRPRSYAAISLKTPELDKNRLNSEKSRLREEEAKIGNATGVRGVSDPSTGRVEDRVEASAPSAIEETNEKIPDDITSDQPSTENDRDVQGGEGPTAKDGDAGVEGNGIGDGTQDAAAIGNIDDIKDKIRIVENEIKLLDEKEGKDGVDVLKKGNNVPEGTDASDKTELSELGRMVSDETVETTPDKAKEPPKDKEQLKGEEEESCIEENSMEKLPETDEEAEDPEKVSDTVPNSKDGVQVSHEVPAVEGSIEGLKAISHADGGAQISDNVVDTDDNTKGSDTVVTADGDTKNADATPDADGDTKSTEAKPFADGDTKSTEATPDTDGDTKSTVATPDTDGDTKSTVAKPDTDGDTKSTEATPNTDGDTKSTVAKPFADGDTEIADATPDTDGDTKSTVAKPFADGDTKSTVAKPFADGDTEIAEATPDTEGDTKNTVATPDTDGDTKSADATPDADGDAKSTEATPDTDGDTKSTVAKPDTDGDAKSTEDTPDTDGDTKSTVAKPFADGITEIADATPDADGDTKSTVAKPFADGDTEIADATPDADGDTKSADATPDADGDAKSTEDTPDTDGDTKSADAAPDADGNTKSTETKPFVDGDTKSTEATPDTDGDTKRQDAVPQADDDSQIADPASKNDNNKDLSSIDTERGKEVSSTSTDTTMIEESPQENLRNEREDDSFIKVNTNEDTENRKGDDASSTKPEPEEGTEENSFEVKEEADANAIGGPDLLRNAMKVMETGAPGRTNVEELDHSKSTQEMIQAEKLTLPNANRTSEIQEFLESERQHSMNDRGAQHPLPFTSTGDEDAARSDAPAVTKDLTNDSVMDDVPPSLDPVIANETSTKGMREENDETSADPADNDTTGLFHNNAQEEFDIDDKDSSTTSGEMDFDDVKEPKTDEEIDEFPTDKTAGNAGDLTGEDQDPSPSAKDAGEEENEGPAVEDLKPEEVNGESGTNAEPKIVLELDVDKESDPSPDKEESQEQAPGGVGHLLVVPTAVIEENPVIKTEYKPLGSKSESEGCENSRSEHRKHSGRDKRSASDVAGVDESEEGKMHQQNTGNSEIAVSMIECGNVGNEPNQSLTHGRTEQDGEEEEEEDILQVEITTVVHTEITPSDALESVTSYIQPQLETTVETKIYEGDVGSGDGENLTLIGAAIVIQNTFRRYKSRKQISQERLDEKLGNDSNHPVPPDAKLEADSDAADQSVSDHSETVPGTTTGGNDFKEKNLSRSATKALLETRSLEPVRKISPLKTRSLTSVRSGAEDFEVWNQLVFELEVAATKIQSNYRGYKTRKRLKRENAIQSSMTPQGTSSLSEQQALNERSTGEFHDSIVLSVHPK